MSYSLHAHAGAKVAEPNEIPSPASTVPGTDEAAAEMARQSYQASKMQTPQDKIRKAPATPQNPPLPRRIQSVELLSAQPLDSQSASGVPMPEPSESCQPKASAKPAAGIKKAKSTLTRKKTKKVKKSAKSKHHPSTTKKIAPKSNAPAPTQTQTENIRPGKASEKTPDVSPDTCPVAASARLPLPPPAIPPTTSQPEAALPPKAEETAPAIPPETKTAVKEEASEPGKSPQPESVRMMLNRAQTTDGMDLMAMTEAVRETVKSALSNLASPESSPRTDELPKKVIGRSKETHARRMRFYRSLESLLDQVGLMRQQPSAQEIENMNVIVSQPCMNFVRGFQGFEQLLSILILAVGVSFINEGLLLQRSPGCMVS